ncbi:MAG: PAS domain-containing protein [Verrucomicrobia bacterium]|nr:PAS domain-containing protein [Verrucomicrobiota bacterium]
MRKKKSVPKNVAATVANRTPRGPTHLRARKSQWSLNAPPSPSATARPRPPRLAAPGNGEEPPAQSSLRPGGTRHQSDPPCGVGLETPRAEETVEPPACEPADALADAPVSVHWVGPDGVILSANQAALELFGGMRAQFVGHHISELYAPTPTADVGGGADMFQRLRCREPLRDYETQLRCPDGALKQVCITADAHWEDDRFVRARCFTWNISPTAGVGAREEGLKARARQHAAVAELGQLALAGTNLSALLQEAIALLVQTLGVEFCKFLELLPAGDEFILRAGAGWKSEVVGQARVAAGNNSQAGYTLQVNEPVVVADLRTETRFGAPALLLEHGVISGMTVIIPGRNRPLGVLGVHTARPRQFTTDDVNFLQAFANVLAQAIERKRAETELRRARTELEQALQERRAELLRANRAMQIEISQRQEAEAEMKRRETQLREAQRLTHVGSWEWEVTTNKLWCSDELYRVLGLSHNQFTPTAVVGVQMTFEAFLGLVHPEDRARVKENVEKALVDHEPFVFEQRIVRPDRGVRTLHTRGHVALDAAGRAAKMLGVCLDITQDKQTEEEIKKREFQLVEAQRLARLGSWEWHIATNKVIWSAELCRLYGIEWQVLPTDLDDFLRRVYPSDYSAVQRTIEQAYQDQRPFELEYRVLLPDNNLRWLHGLGRVVADASGRRLRMLGTAQDITERKQAEEALRENESRKSAILEAALDCVITADREGRIIDFNPAAERTFGYKHYEVVGEELAAKLIPPAWRERHRQGLARYLATGETTMLGKRIEITAMRADGSIFPVELCITPVRLKGNTVFMACLRDITERKRAEAWVAGQKQVLEMITTGATLAEVLETLLRAVEAESPGMTCSVLLLDEDGKRLRHGAAPSLSEAYNQAVDGLPIGPQAGSCGTAVYRRETVIVADITRDPLWSDYRELADCHGLRACWSTPIKTTQGKILGTLAMLYHQPHTPSARDRELIEVATHLAGIVIERHRAEEALRKSELGLARAQKIAHLGNWDWDLVTNKVRWSDEIYRIFGLTPEQFGATYEAFLNSVHPDDRSIVNEAVQDALKRGRPYNVDHRIIRPDGAVRIVSEQGEVVFDEAGKPVRFLGTVLDVTERKEAESKLQDYSERLQTLSRRLLEAQESERRHIARELHDEIGQSLTALKINLQAAQRQCEAAGAVTALEEGIGIVDQVLQQVRNLSVDLHPSILDDLGLVAALRWYLDRQSQLAGFIAQFEAVRFNSPLSPELVTACFRIAQEALTNVVRHAKAKQVRLELRQQGEELKLAVCDDGVGFDVVAARKRAVRGASSLGLLGMEERVSLIGGRIEFKSTPKKGTEVCAWFPLREETHRPQEG